MALVSPPDDLNLDSDATTPMSFAAEGDNVQQENRELSDLVAWVTNRYQRAKDSRSDDEERWLLNYRNYRGIYGPDVAFTDKEKSRAFIKITKTKVLAAFAQISDILFAGGKFPIGIQPTQMSSGAADAVHVQTQEEPEEKKSTSTAKRVELVKTGPYADLLEEVEDELNEGASGQLGALLWEPTKLAAKKMENRGLPSQVPIASAKEVPGGYFENRTPEVVSSNTCRRNSASGAGDIFSTVSPAANKSACNK